MYARTLTQTHVSRASINQRHTHFTDIHRRKPRQKNRRSNTNPHARARRHAAPRLGGTHSQTDTVGAVQADALPHRQTGIGRSAVHTSRPGQAPFAVLEIEITREECVATTVAPEARSRQGWDHLAGAMGAVRAWRALIALQCTLPVASRTGQGTYSWVRVQGTGNWRH